MPTQFVNFTLPNYLADWDTLGKNTPLSARFNKPPAMADATVTTILAAIGGTVKNPADKVPCAPPSSFSPRKLVFHFTTGGSLSIPFSLRSQGLPLATQIRNLLQTDVAPVSCVQLKGERWGRVDEELRPTGTVIAPGVDIRVTTGSKSPVFTRAFSYVSDDGRTSVQNARQNTDSLAVPALPFSPYAAAINTALGAGLPKGCGGVGNIDPRHYTVTVLTTDTVNPVRKLIVPVAATGSITIRAVGVALATLGQTMCLAYEGESDSRLSRLIV